MPCCGFPPASASRKAVMLTLPSPLPPSPLPKPSAYFVSIRCAPAAGCTELLPGRVLRCVLSVLS